MNVTVIGGGVIGLCSAYYLRKAGFDVTVIERIILPMDAHSGTWVIYPLHTLFRWQPQELYPRV